MEEWDERGHIIIKGTITTSSILFWYCYYGNSTTKSYLDFGDCVYNSNWSNFPHEYQKYYISMIGIAQRPLQYHGFGVVVLNLATYIQVSFGFDQNLIRSMIQSILLSCCQFQIMRGVVSYFVIFKMLNEK